MKVREKAHLNLLNVFIVIEYNYKKMIFYKIFENSVKKMTMTVYTQEILSVIKDDLLSYELTL